MSAAPKKPDEKKKIIFLAVLLAVAAVVLYINVFSGDSEGPVSARPAQPAAVAPSAPAAEAARREPGRTSLSEFKPRQGPARPEDRIDPATIDPTLRLDLLAKIQAVEPEQALRNIFQYGAAAPPPPTKMVALPSNTPHIAMNHPPTPPPGQPRPGGPGAPGNSGAPPITFKYYGFKTSKATGKREAFLLDGDDIIIGAENDAVKGGRYRIIRIGPTTITIEDTQFKANQTLTLQEDPAAA